MHAVATIGPISVGIDARHESFKLYRGGKWVFTYVCQSMILDSFGGQTTPTQELHIRYLAYQTFTL